MKWIIPAATLTAWLASSLPVVADDFTYEGIAARYADVRLSSAEAKAARMHGECLVGLKKLIFVRRDKVDPVAEWINYRSLSLLEQFPPCEVLIMMQVARVQLMEDAATAP